MYYHTTTNFKHMIDCISPTLFLYLYQHRLHATRRIENYQR